MKSASIWDLMVARGACVNPLSISSRVHLAILPVASWFWTTSPRGRMTLPWLGENQSSGGAFSWWWARRTTVFWSEGIASYHWTTPHWLNTLDAAPGSEPNFVTFKSILLAQCSNLQLINQKIIKTFKFLFAAQAQTVRAKSAKSFSEMDKLKHLV